MIVAERQQQTRILRQGVALQLVGNHRGVDQQVDGPDPGGMVPVNRQNKRNAIGGGERVLDHLVIFLCSLVVQSGNLADIVDRERSGHTDRIIELQEFSVIIRYDQPADIIVGAVNLKVLLHRAEYIQRIPGLGIR
ncbi:hypothetical protein D3C80_1269830 [compost metagenome]